MSQDFLPRISWMKYCLPLRSTSMSSWRRPPPFQRMSQPHLRGRCSVRAGRNMPCGSFVVHAVEVHIAETSVAETVHSCRARLFTQRLQSMAFWRPALTGRTTIWRVFPSALLMSTRVRLPLFSLRSVSSGVSVVTGVPSMAVTMSPAAIAGLSPDSGPAGALRICGAPGRYKPCRRARQGWRCGRLRGFRSRPGSVRGVAHVEFAEELAE